MFLLTVTKQNHWDKLMARELYKLKIHQNTKYPFLIWRTKKMNGKRKTYTSTLNKKIGVRFNLKGFSLRLPVNFDSGYLH